MDEWDCGREMAVWFRAEKLREVCCITTKNGSGPYWLCMYVVTRVLVLGWMGMSHGVECSLSMLDMPSGTCCLDYYSAYCGRLYSARVI